MSDERYCRFQRQCPPRAGGRDLPSSRRAALAVPAHALRQRLPGGPAPGQLPGARRLPHPAAGAAGAGAPGRAAADAGRGPGRLGGPDHRGDAALRLRPLGQEGRAAHLHRRPAGGRPAGRGRRQPGADHDPALAAGARVLQRPGRPPARAARAGRALPASTTCPTRSSVSPDLGNAKEAAAFARLLGVAGGGRGQAALQPTTGCIISAIIGDVGGQGRDRAGRRDRQGQHGHRTARPAARRKGPLDPRRLHAWAVRRRRAASASASSPTCRRSSAPTPCRSPAEKRGAQADGAVDRPARWPRRCAASTTANR